ncbi:class I SAM-dependent methyltransferase [Fulvivirga sp. M361]|uniref:class I SAM-dependent methyltransferase n=1 Tax=Fulvivirga sp. M361 TaxID=2594266 RepID=UPI00117A4602|nr:class I SAM-dependent methyltransferase [Fulvivirga sp. M361]TRX58673.1 class I SAM-dependent methyltransferase [Fulvivirga sp. M361]
MLEQLENCPVCHDKQFHNELTCKDHTVSSENFVLVRCQKCSFLFTNPRPSSANIGNYYQSDNYVSHQNKANNLINLIYKLSRHFTLINKVKLINKLQAVGKLLDVGCGTGHFLSYASKSNWHVQGIEPDIHARQNAEQLTQSKIHSSLEDITEEQFNVITLWHVLEHVPDLDGYILSITRLLTSDGTIIVAVPNHKSYDAQLYKEYWAGYDVPRHLYHFSQNTMKRLLSNYNLEITHTLPMKLDAFYVSLLSEKYMGTGFKGLIKSLINGLKSNNYASKHTNDYSSLIYIIRSK